MSRILIVEDDVYFQEILEAILEDAGHKCTVEQSALSIIENIDRLNQYNAIILDLMMPKHGLLQSSYDAKLAAGEILYGEIRKKYKSKKIIIITAKDMKQINLNLAHDNNLTVYYKPADETTINKLLEELA